MLFVRLLFRSVCLALAQIWANKVRSILTMLGIIIGVASITAVLLDSIRKGQLVRMNRRTIRVEEAESP
jgi:hypothetical protein